MSLRDGQFLARAIRLAARGRLSCAPNPQVGCVIVRGDVIVGEGWHQRAGQAHAEVNALAMAGDRARGATAYVSLEPCNHQGRTGPCSQALIKAGIKRVVFAAPDASGASGGAQALREAGVEVSSGLLQAEAAALNPGFHRRMSGGRPWLRMKLAMSLDGRSALPDGRSQWITGAQARLDGHRWRARSCAMITGVGTVLADDPQMTARLPHDSVQQPLRVVLDREHRTPRDARLRADAHYLILHASREPVRNGQSLPVRDERLDLHAAVDALAARGCNEILVEAGPTVSAAFLRAELVDEVIIYAAPALLGQGLPAAELGVLDDLDARIRLDWLDSRRIGDDLRIIARPQTRI